MVTIRLPTLEFRQMIIYDTNGDRIHAKRVVIRGDGWGYAFRKGIWLQIVYRSKSGYWVVTGIVVSHKEVLKELTQ